MVDEQIRARGVGDPKVLEAMSRAPRERFVPSDLQESAYDDNPLPIGHGQTISQPFIVALMVEALELQPGERVLEVGTGSGYAAAVLAEIADAVFTIERHGELATRARRDLIAAGYENVSVMEGDGTLGWPEAAPFDAILVSAGSPVVPESLKRQLAIGGRLVIPVGPETLAQHLLRITRTGLESFQLEDLGAVRFVRLIGAEGWSDAD
ncbi:MAG: protein-L-isoaspartate(D-aspartate) O-methyltransferase [Gammaproteobacteria bacterium]|nr:MAG: protein-L-isoaspartate(D-aspartate) O-methyltransferase [Gammaproteobacteria bacterium]